MSAVALCRQTGGTIEQFAEHTGLSRQTLNNWAINPDKQKAFNILWRDWLRSRGLNPDDYIIDFG